MNASTSKKSDLGTRTLSAIVMVAVAGTALWLGGWLWTVFVALVALGVLREWWGLASAITAKLWARALWLVLGLVYVAVPVLVLASLRMDSRTLVLLPILAVMATDVGAYFAGRTIGGPKIAPRISPSKTWSGLLGGIIASFASIALFLLVVGCAEAIGDDCWNNESLTDWHISLPAGALVAIVAQAGDFFESWMKRRAGVKDSGKLLPGHGGLFDRVDGLLAVLFVLGIMSMIMGRLG